jgi:hypothetical protein
MKKETIFPNKSFDWFLLQPPIYQTEDINLLLLQRCQRWNKKHAAIETLKRGGSEDWLAGDKEGLVQSAYEDFVCHFFNGKGGEVIINEKYKFKTIDGICPRIIERGNVSNDIDTLKKIVGVDEPIQIYCENHNFDKVVSYIKDNPYIDLCSLKEFHPNSFMFPKSFENYIFVLYKNDISPITLKGYDVVSQNENEKDETLFSLTIELYFGIFVKHIQRQILIDLN